MWIEVGGVGCFGIFFVSFEMMFWMGFCNYQTLYVVALAECVLCFLEVLGRKIIERNIDSMLDLEI